jgi:hypothetical protein
MLSGDLIMALPTSNDAWKDGVRRASRYAFIGFAAIAAFFLITEHSAHLLGWLPFLIILACPFLHMVGHGGHRGHDPGEKRPDDRAAGPGGASVRPDRNDPATHHHH